MRSVRTLLVTSLIATLVATSATQASAQTVDTLPCPATTPDAGFSDVDVANIHKRDIDCIAHWGITTQTGTYGPSQPVTRWQMALFLTRTASLVQALPDGTPSGFSDIGALTTEAQLAVYQLAELSITADTSPTTYGPEAAVTREQMAVFLVRTVRAVGVTLPDGSTQGFTDIAALGAESQAAINQVRQLRHHLRHLRHHLLPVNIGHPGADGLLLGADPERDLDGVVLRHHQPVGLHRPAIRSDRLRRIRALPRGPHVHYSRGLSKRLAGAVECS